MAGLFYLKNSNELPIGLVEPNLQGNRLKALNKINKEKLLIRACHSCLKLNESDRELERCSHCNKAFLPLRYFDKIHQDKNVKFDKHFSSTEDIEEEDLIKGLFVLW